MEIVGDGYPLFDQSTSDLFTGELRLPRLENLVIHNPSDGDIEIPSNISAPSLQTLSAQHYQFPLRSEPGLHSKLVQLSFRACLDSMPFAPEHYHILLSSAPYLEKYQFMDTTEKVEPRWRLSERMREV
ncbi:hypothetical protein FRC02_000799 [Tulasnella sp. 418]|nr:hypothetical protein FRC02_000799 [Tulasnella sp. 418]